MKRPKDRFGKFEYYNDHNISGLKVFDGEDLEYQDRMKYQTMQQNAWIQQQKYENEMKKQQEREEERRYAEQTLSINRMRSMLESEHEQKIRCRQWEKIAQPNRRNFIYGFTTLGRTNRRNCYRQGQEEKENCPY